MDRENVRKIISLRHLLHQHPELSMQEVQTKGILMEFLREHTSLELVDRGSWFYAVKRAEREPAVAGSAEQTRAERDLAEQTLPARIAFRTDMDALPMGETIDLPYASLHPGISHKCGHDGHMAALCGLAMELDLYDPGKTVYLIFQPGEEIGAGALICKDLLQEENISEIYAFHNLSGYPEGTVLYHPETTQPASEGLIIRLTGRTSHAAEPEKGSNPAQAIASIILEAQKLAECEQKQLLFCTVTGVRVGAGDFGISPGDGELRMTLRSDAEPKMKELESRILEFARERADEFGLQMEFEIRDYFPETRNHPACLEKVRRAATQAGVPVMKMDSLWRPSEDFGYYLKECPGALFYVGNGTGHPAVHTGAYDFNDRILEPAVDVLLRIAME
ncbi:MAG: amidohydrolase [Parasporobacterium sp.]|nr:amidohydrolase [Parasporobacterium sp.]